MEVQLSMLAVHLKSVRLADQVTGPKSQWPGAT